jgi:hypothetical protein
MDQIELTWLLDSMRGSAERILRQRGHVEPMFFIVDGSGDLTITPWTYSNEPEKYEHLNAVKALARVLLAKAVGIVSEMWCVEASIQEAAATLAMKARNNPNRREYLMASIDTPDTGFNMWLAELNRTGARDSDDGAFLSLGEWKQHGADRYSGELMFFPRPRSLARV